jgi:hypothetical protein
MLARSHTTISPLRLSSQAQTATATAVVEKRASVCVNCNVALKMTGLGAVSSCSNPVIYAHLDHLSSSSSITHHPSFRPTLPLGSPARQSNRLFPPYIRKTRSAVAEVTLRMMCR